MKWKQSRPGFELGSPGSFPTTISYTISACTFDSFTGQMTWFRHRGITPVTCLGKERSSRAHPSPYLQRVLIRFPSARPVAIPREQSAPLFGEEIDYYFPQGYQRLVKVTITPRAPPYIYIYIYIYIYLYIYISLTWVWL